uniref:MTOR-associated protein MEAK7 n=1 Tax=Glossina austeni TaxID=7395 RepID=A0A1A9UTY9_GLOAU
MGNSTSNEKQQQKYVSLTPQEQRILENSFKLLASGGNTKDIKTEQIRIAWRAIVGDAMTEYVINFFNSRPKKAIDYSLYLEPYLIMEKYDKTQQINFLGNSLSEKGASPDGNLVLEEIQKYVSAVVKTYRRALPFYSDSFETWKKHGYRYEDQTAETLANAFLKQFYKESKTLILEEELEKFLQYNFSFQIMWREVIAYLYGYRAPDRLEKLLVNTEPLLPALEGLTEAHKNYKPIMEIPHTIYMNSHLHYTLRNKWRFLFSSKIMGESFSTMLGKILNRGPTMLVVEDEDNYLFAGFAPQSWSKGLNFGGDDTSMLFTLRPEMRSFASTKYNDHYQYLHISQQTLPNGLGMGGQFNYWGLWLDSEYGKGQSSETCTTFRDYVQLSKQKEFRIKNVEVWGVGDEPKLSEDSDDEEINVGRIKFKNGTKFLISFVLQDTNKKSVLDKNLEDRVMLQMSGHKMHSEGLREPEMDL